MVFYKKKGFPNEGDIVLCKVTKILPHSVFAELLEYNNKEGMIHISEISSKWTRNISDVVSVGKQIVCRVERINQEKGYIDLSKKRVTSGEEKKKKNEEKNENRVEKLIEYAIKKNNMSLKDFYDKTGYQIIEEYGGLHNFYESYLEEPEIIKDLKIDKKIADDIVKVFESLVQKSRVTVKRKINFYARGSNGLNQLKDFIKKIISSVKLNDNVLDIVYMNSPEYLVTVNSKNYKEANNLLDEFVKKFKEYSKEYDISVLE